MILLSTFDLPVYFSQTNVVKLYASYLFLNLYLVGWQLCSMKNKNHSCQIWWRSDKLWIFVVSVTAQSIGGFSGFFFLGGGGKLHSDSEQCSHKILLPQYLLLRGRLPSWFLHHCCHKHLCMLTFTLTHTHTLNLTALFTEWSFYSCPMYLIKINFLFYIFFIHILPTY